MVEPQAADRARRVLVLQHQPVVALQSRDQINRRVLPPVDLVVHQRRHRRRRIRHDRPHHAVEMRHLRPGGKAVRAARRPRHIIRIALHHDARARNPLIGLELERPAANHLGNLTVGVGLGDPLRHHRRGVLRQRIRQQPERLLQLDLDHLVRRRTHLIHRQRQRLPQRIALVRPRHRSHRIARQNRRAVMELQPVAQRDLPNLAIGRSGGAGRHLRMRRAALVHPIQRVINRQRNVARHIRRRPNRVQRRGIGMRHKAQSARVLPPNHRRCGQHRSASQRSLENIAATHISSP